jgi:hypothetical protein
MFGAAKRAYGSKNAKIARSRNRIYARASRQDKDGTTLTGSQNRPLRGLECHAESCRSSWLIQLLKQNQNPESNGDMSKEFSVRLVDRTEVVEYRDAKSVYRFYLRKRGSEWIVYTPSSRQVPATEVDIILGRITAYLEKRKWFWIFPRKYTVKIESK